MARTRNPSYEPLDSPPDPGREDDANIQILDSVLRRGGRQLPGELSLLSDASTRPVDARGRIAGRLFPGVRSHGSDPWIDKAVRYLHARRACRTGADRESLAQKMPDLHTAYQLYEGDDRLARGTVEGRLLSGQTIEEVAAACNLTAGAVAAYHALFFDVMGRLKARSYILNYAIGVGPCDELSEEDVDVILKRAGFLKGPIFLEWVLRYYRTELKVPSRLEGLSREQLADLHDLLSVRNLILAWVLPAEDMGRVTLLQALLDELKGLIDAWPGPTVEGQKPGHVVLSLTPADREAWWAVWRQAAGAADAGRGLEGPGGTQVA
jgi:hypothetical protein